MPARTAEMHKEARDAYELDYQVTMISDAMWDHSIDAVDWFPYDK